MKHHLQVCRCNSSSRAFSCFSRNFCSFLLHIKFDTEGSRERVRSAEVMDVMRLSSSIMNSKRCIVRGLRGLKIRQQKKGGWELIAIDPINSLKKVNSCLYGPSIVDIPHWIALEVPRRWVSYNFPRVISSY